MNLYMSLHEIVVYDSDVLFQEEEANDKLRSRSLLSVVTNTT